MRVALAELLEMIVLWVRWAKGRREKLTPQIPACVLLHHMV